MYMLKYVHAKSHCLYYFVDFRSLDGVLSPIGCFPYRRKAHATIFESESDAMKVYRYLFSQGHSVSLVRVRSN